MNIENFGLILFQIWYFDGDERFRFLLPPYSKDASGVMYLFSLSDKETLLHLDVWLPIMRRFNPSVPIMVVGTRISRNDTKSVQKSEVAEIIRPRGVNEYLELIIEVEKNVDEIFRAMADLMIF